MNFNFEDGSTLYIEAGGNTRGIINKKGARPVSITLDYPELLRLSQNPMYIIALSHSLLPQVVKIDD